jgi:hypothetical protein
VLEKFNDYLQIEYDRRYVAGLKRKNEVLKAINERLTEIGNLKHKKRELYIG